MTLKLHQLAAVTAFGSALVEARKARELSQADLTMLLTGKNTPTESVDVEGLMFAQPTLSAIETGKTQPSSALFKRIVKELDSLKAGPDLAALLPKWEAAGEARERQMRRIRLTGGARVSLTRRANMSKGTGDLLPPVPTARRSRPPPTPPTEPWKTPLLDGGRYTMLDLQPALKAAHAAGKTVTLSPASALADGTLLFMIEQER